MGKFFSNFPVVNYPGIGEIRDITSAVDIDVTGTLKKVDNQAGTRPDVIAHRYYDDSQLDWLVVMSNGKINPYDLLAVDRMQFERIVTDMFGSFEAANEKIVHWRHNWRGATRISPSEYAELPKSAKALFTPIQGDSSTVVEYARRRIEVFYSTNRIISVDLTEDHEYQEGDVVKMTNLAHHVGNGEVVGVIGKTLLLKNAIYTAFDAIGDNPIRSMAVKSTPLPDELLPFFEPVTALTQLEEHYAKRESINIMSTSDAQEVGRQLAGAF